MMTRAEKEEENDDDEMLFSNDGRERFFLTQIRSNENAIAFLVLRDARVRLIYLSFLFSSDSFEPTREMSVHSFERKCL